MERRLDWIYKNEIFTSEQIGDNYGFVYIITNLTTNKKYIGKKFFWKTKTNQIKGKKKKSKIESDWLKYYGSNELLKEDVTALGKDNFSREILHLCKTKGECNYLEAKEQFIRCVLECSEYYNTWIFLRVHKKHIKNLLIE